MSLKSAVIITFKALEKWIIIQSDNMMLLWKVLPACSFDEYSNEDSREYEKEASGILQ